MGIDERQSKVTTNCYDMLLEVTRTTLPDARKNHYQRKQHRGLD